MADWGRTWQNMQYKWQSYQTCCAVGCSFYRLKARFLLSILATTSCFLQQTFILPSTMIPQCTMISCLYLCSQLQIPNSQTLNFQAARFLGQPHNSELLLLRSEFIYSRLYGMYCCGCTVHYATTQSSYRVYNAHIRMSIKKIICCFQFPFFPFPS